MNEERIAAATRAARSRQGQGPVRKLVAGPGVFICDQCIRLCQEVLRTTTFTGTKSRRPASIPNPKTICAALDQYVIGQDGPRRSSRSRSTTLQA